MDGAWHPPAAVLELAELVTEGLLDGLPAPLANLAELPETLQQAPAVTLEDAEGTGVAVVRGLAVEPLRPFAGPPLRAARLTLAEVRAQLGGRVDDRKAYAVVADGPLGADQVAGAIAHARDEDATLLWVALTGAGRTGLPPEGLLRAVRAVAAEATAAGVRSVVFPLVVPLLPAELTVAFDGEDRGGEPEWMRSPEDAALVLGVLAACGAAALLPLAEPELPVHPAFAAEVARAHRPPGRRGVTVFFTGLSGSGKSTVAKALQQRLADDGRRTVSLLDGDEVRRLLSAGLGFSRADRDLNIRRIGFVATEVSRHGGLAVCAPIAPFAAVRAEVRTMVEAVGDFVLVHVSTPLEVCEARDRKGLYAKARRGELADFTGISSPYEEPVDAELVIDTSQLTVDAAVDRVWALLASRGYLPDPA